MRQRRRALFRRRLFRGTVACCVCASVCVSFTSLAMGLQQIGEQFFCCRFSQCITRIYVPSIHIYPRRGACEHPSGGTGQFTRRGTAHDATLVSAVREAADGLHAAVLRPNQLFVAWDGVLVLAFEGFPADLARLKERLGSSNVGKQLVKEGFGSKWPKTTLAALTDSAPPLTGKDLSKLKSLCKAYHSRITRSKAIEVRAVSVVDYQARALEEVTGRTDIALQRPVSDGAPSAAERKVVDGVLEEWGDMDAYLKRVNGPGSKASSYREKSPRGSTLVAFWGTEGLADSELRGVLDEFRSDVEVLLPGYYSWHQPASYHCTLRALKDAPAAGSTE